PRWPASGATDSNPWLWARAMAVGRSAFTPRFPQTRSIVIARFALADPLAPRAMPARPATPMTRRKSRREGGRVVILSSSAQGIPRWPVGTSTADQVLDGWVAHAPPSFSPYQPDAPARATGHSALAGASGWYRIDPVMVCATQS